jgi:hypothetical protein
MKPKRVCRICGISEDQHHVPDWVRVPDGCVCDIGTWDSKTVPKPCGEYQGNGRTHCEVCEHDKACHAGTEQSA